MKLKILVAVLAAAVLASIPLTGSANCDPLSPRPSDIPPPPAPPPPPAITIDPASYPPAYSTACAYLQHFLDTFGVTPAGATPTYLVQRMYRLNFRIGRTVGGVWQDDTITDCLTPLRINTALPTSDRGQIPLCIAGLNVQRAPSASFTDPLITVTTTDPGQRRRVDIRDVHIANVNAGIKFDIAGADSSVYGGDITAAAGAAGIGVHIRSQQSFVSHVAISGFTGGEGVRCEANGCQVINESVVSGNGLGVRIMTGVTSTALDHSKVYGNTDHNAATVVAVDGIRIESDEPAMRIFDIRESEVVELNRRSETPLEFQGTPNLVIPALAAVGSGALLAGRVEFYKSDPTACGVSGVSRDIVGQGCGFTSGPKGILRTALAAGAVSVDPWQGWDPQPDDLEKPIVAVINITGGKTTSFTPQIKMLGPTIIFVSSAPISIATTGGAIDGSSSSSTTDATTVAALTGTELTGGAHVADGHVDGGAGAVDADPTADDTHPTSVADPNIERSIDPRVAATVVAAEAPPKSCGLFAPSDDPVRTIDVWMSLWWIITLAAIGPVYARVARRRPRRGMSEKRR